MVKSAKESELKIPKDAAEFFNPIHAFAQKSDKDLKLGFLLFKLISFPFFSQIFIKVGASIRKLPWPTSYIIKKTVFRQFCGGESVEESLPLVNDLAKSGVTAILDYSAESKNTEDDFLASYTQIEKTIVMASHEQNNTGRLFAVFKPTALVDTKVLEAVSSAQNLSDSEQKHWNTFVERVDALCALAKRRDIALLIDAEESWFQNAIDQVVLTMMIKYNKEQAVVYNTIQLYRHDRLAYLQALYAETVKNAVFLGLKLVRGAYLEKENLRAKQLMYESPIQKNKKNTDSDFDAAVEFCLENINRISVFIATHNADSTFKALKKMQVLNLANSDERVVFSQLYGMGDHLTYNLAKAGYRATKYLPFGPIKEVMPYLLRRIQENSSVRGQAGRELQLISQELRRRNQERI
ncbi:MAG: proline dehydrogenase family protein [Oligoflexales bacterium]|nr:proline dehydrogenase family protein [Oligoflexales bacterium]